MTAVEPDTVGEDLLFDLASPTGRLMQSQDWSRTVLGPVGYWSETLKVSLRLMLANDAPAFIWWGADLIHLHNDACARLFGRRRVLGKPAHEIRRDIWAAIGTEACDVMTDNRALTVRERRVVISRNGRPGELYCTFLLTPIRDDWGCVVGVLGIAQDESDAVAARRQNAEAVAHDYPAEPDNDENRDEFLAMLAHELRNPLAPIRSAAELLAYVDSNPLTLGRAREIIERQLEQLVRLVDDLLDASRVSRGTIELKRSPTDLRAALRNAIESVRPLIDAAGHELDVRVPERPVPVHGDRVRLTQAIANVLTNAAQYTEPGGRIVVELDRTRRREARVTVTDDGIGLDAANVSRIFEMFTQGEQRRDEPRHGLGIGLAISKRLVELHGGTIEASSEGPGLGSRFVVTLPLLGAVRADATAPHNGYDKHTMRILVADDNTDAAAAMAEVLGAVGHDVRTADDGLEAIEVAERFRPELILLDIGMPRLDGYETCRRIRKRPWGVNVAIYAVTGWGQASDRRRTREAGFNAHLVKPVSIAAIQKLMAADAR